MREGGGPGIDPKAPPAVHAGPLVTVVIPTRNRPRLVERAVLSALRQTLKRIEIIVVLDGPDPATLKRLRAIADPRLRIKTLERRLGSGGARQAGVNDAGGEWVAFLDDDDEWLPDKLEIQLRSAHRSTSQFPIISCRVIARTGTGDRVWPRRRPRPGEHISEYLLCQRTLGEGLVLMITIFTKRELLLRVPFRSLRRHPDLDWLIRANHETGATVEFVKTGSPLAVWHMDHDRVRIGNRPDWRYSFSWIRGIRPLVTPRAYAAFVLTWLSEKAVQQREWKAMPYLLGESFRGSPGFIDLLLFMFIWLIPHPARRRLAGMFGL